ncbi:MAG: thioesterase [Acutalibacteraceae bacterium]|nr:thioesterase [Acutalibacteraceae bacterium]
MNSSEYIYDFNITSFDVGYKGMLRYSSILKYQQEAGEQHMHHYGYDMMTLMDRGYAFVISCTAVVINRLPCINEKIRMVTWNRGQKGIRFFRSYNWYDESGDLIIEGCSSVALVDFKNHGLADTTVLGDPMPSDFERTNSAGTPKRARITVGNDITSYEIVKPSRIDNNGHLNNTYYADIVFDNLPESCYLSLAKGFTIDFVTEAKLGDRIDIKSKAMDNSVHLCGMVGEDVCFKAIYEI